MPEPKQFFFQDGEEIVGPLTGIQLREAAFAGRVAPDTSVRIGQDSDWFPAQRLNNLFDSGGQALPHPPASQALLEKAKKQAAVWYLRRGVAVLGPFSSDELRAKADSGEIAPETRIMKGPQGTWVPAGCVRGLFALDAAEIEAIAAEVLLPPQLLDEPGD